MMIHIKNAVRVIASGKMRRSTIQSGAFYHQPISPTTHLSHGMIGMSRGTRGMEVKIQMMRRRGTGRQGGTGTYIQFNFNGTDRVHNYH